ncbi:unnamed protein product [Mesocestoides corti]|uniref:Enoyl-CoA hydratase n=1 Tax=Mesocestoides corti TaxID=53468 RepID=A0A0R3U456_MESCO|nr:unnamed protein product [Mesocestoides corti]
MKACSRRFRESLPKTIIVVAPLCDLVASILGMLKVAFVKKLAVSGTCLRLLSSLGQHESVIVSRRGRDCQIGLVQLNKPESHNALSPNLIDQLASSVEELDADASIRCLVLTGSEKVFSVGADVKHLASLEPSDVATEDVLHKWDVLASVKKPLIAVVNGPALGGGCELAMMCDVIYAGENARFGQPEIKLATIPGVGGTQRLIRAIGKSRAMEIILSGESISAKKAYEFGLVSCIHPVSEVLEKAISLAERISVHSLPALITVKAAVNSGRRRCYGPIDKLHAAIVSLHRINELRWHPLILNIDLSKRLGVSLAVNGHTLYIFGGCTPELTAMNDLITLDLLTLKWMRVATQGNVMLFSLSRCALITASLYIEVIMWYGIYFTFLYYCTVGNHRLVSVNDLYSFCPKSNTWTLVLQHEKGPPLSKYCNGVFLPPVDTESDTYPPLLVLSDGSNERVYPYALLPETGRWFPIPPCPHRAPPAGGPAGHRGPSPYRPAMCALGQKQVLVVCRGVTQPSVWILSRSDRRPNQVSLTVSWTWTQVRMQPPSVASAVPPADVHHSVAVPLPSLRPQAWPTVLFVSTMGSSVVRTQLNRNRRSRMNRRPSRIGGPVLRSPSASSSSPRGPPFPPPTPNPLIKVFVELPGQPLSGAIVRRVPSEGVAPPPSISSTSAKLQSPDISEGGFVGANSSASERLLAAYALCLLPAGDEPTAVVGHWSGPSANSPVPNYFPREHRYFSCVYALGSLLVLGGKSVDPLDTDDQRTFQMWAVHGKNLVCGFAEHI